ncbi:MULTISPECIES: GNAT family N-acetyltransferase [unclassified Paludibacterium]|uniref:GNAT family N-acetyltransferase n=1 Tax=unclassified Paludibacterium TaxID=2618429 RepID=UPI001C059D81|nr:GNAT family N-acetyltransferase [Paludibacterium sp. B53371]BEV71756.1 hypothetical protein THUN1379_12380 [Paludibacterium sp. THUN1379]
MALNAEIRSARETDADGLSALAMLVWLHTYAVDGIEPDMARHVLHSLSPAQFRRWLADPQQRILLAADGPRLLAYARLNRAPAGPIPEVGGCELETLYVHPGFARRGLGQRLLAACRTAAPAPLWLSIWAYNTAALHFYLAQGMQQVGETTFRLGDIDHPNLLLADTLSAFPHHHAHDPD